MYPKDYTTNLDESLRHLSQDWADAKAQYETALKNYKEIHFFIHFLVTHKIKKAGEVADIIGVKQPRINAICDSIEKSLKGGEK